MTKVLGIDTSNYTTSIAIVENDICIYESRRLLKTKIGERGLRQSEALFQHIINLPELLNTEMVRNIEAVCVSIKPRPVSGSYMPVFKAGESVASSIASTLGTKIFYTTHQEGHIEAAVRSLAFREKDFICFHLSGGTTEILKVSREKIFTIEIIGETKDISAGQFIDRIGVAMGLPFPCGKFLDEYAISSKSTALRIPSKVKEFDLNFSGQETLCLKYLKEGYNQYEVSYAAMLCVAKTMEKVINNLNIKYGLPILFMGGVACSTFIKNYLNTKFHKNIFFADEKYSSDNAVGTAFIGYRSIMEG